MDRPVSFVPDAAIEYHPLLRPGGSRGHRCCYHGWLFDPEGRTLDMPCEPERGLRKNRYRQPWYPMQEYHGMLFAYLGPPEHKPSLPSYDIFDDLPGGWEIIADDNNIGLEGDPTPCNWFQTHDNVMDPFHEEQLAGSDKGSPCSVTAFGNR